MFIKLKPQDHSQSLHMYNVSFKWPYKTSTKHLVMFMQITAKDFRVRSMPNVERLLPSQFKSVLWDANHWRILKSYTRIFGPPRVSQLLSVSQLPSVSQMLSVSQLPSVVSVTDAISIICSFSVTVILIVINIRLKNLAQQRLSWGVTWQHRVE